MKRDPLNPTEGEELVAEARADARVLEDLYYRSIEMSEGVEEYAERTGRLCPEIVDLMRQFLPEWDASQCKVSLNNGTLGGFSGRGSPTAAFVLGDTIFMMRGALNCPRIVRGNNWDLTTPNGFATLAHEIYHVYQNSTGKGCTWWEWVVGCAKSMVYSRVAYDHRFFRFEQEAIAFQQAVFNGLWSRMFNALDVFNGLRGRNA